MSKIILFILTMVSAMESQRDSDSLPLSSYSQSTSASSVQFASSSEMLSELMPQNSLDDSQETLIYESKVVDEDDHIAHPIQLDKQTLIDYITMLSKQFNKYNLLIESKLDNLSKQDLATSFFIKKLGEIQDRHFGIIKQYNDSFTDYEKLYPTEAPMQQLVEKIQINIEESKSILFELNKMLAQLESSDAASAFGSS